MKEDIHNRKDMILTYFHEREVWWTYAGINIGSEQDGKGRRFTRPFLIIRKFNEDILWAVPLSTTLKKNPYYILYTDHNGKDRAAIVSQLRLISSKRLTYKMGRMHGKDFSRIKKAIKDLL